MKRINIVCVFLSFTCMCEAQILKDMLNMATSPKEKCTGLQLKKAEVKRQLAYL